VNAPGVPGVQDCPPAGSAAARWAAFSSCSFVLAQSAAHRGVCSIGHLAGRYYTGRGVLHSVGCEVWLDLQEAPG
jgi:hypothetical protein